MDKQGSESVDLTASLIMSSDVLYDLCCDVCSEDRQNYEADGFCVDCGEYLCKDCVKGHRKNRLSRDHTVQDKTQMPRQKPPVAQKMSKGVCIEKCANHPTRLVEYYCRDDKTLGCSVCMTINHRLCGSLDHIPDMCETLLDSREYKQFTRSLTILRTKSQDVSKRSKENVAKAEKCATDAANAMKALRKQMNEVFDKFEGGLRKKAEDIKHADIKKMKDVVDIGDNVYKEVEKISANLQSLQSKNQLGQLFIQMIKLEETLKKLLQILANADAGNDVTAYIFEPAQNVQGILSDPSSFGKLSVEHSADAVPSISPAEPRIQKQSTSLAQPVLQNVGQHSLASAQLMRQRVSHQSSSSRSTSAYSKNMKAMYVENIKVSKRKEKEFCEDATETDLMIEVKSGSLEKTKADALVCTIPGDLDLGKVGASAALLRAAGYRLQEELTMNYMYPNKLDYGEIAVVSGYDLDCSYVLLGVMNMYDARYDVMKEGPDKFYTVTVHDFMVRCLEEADKLDLSSLAFPAVGCGSLQYPVDIVAREMFTAVTEYRKDHPKSRISHVVFVIYHQDEEALQVFKRKEKEFCQTRRRTDVYDADACQDQPKQQPKPKASPTPNRKTYDERTTCEKTSRQPIQQYEVNQLSDDLKKYKLEDSEENGLYKSKRSKMVHRQFSADSNAEDGEDGNAKQKLCLPDVSNGVAEFFTSKLLGEYSRKGFKFRFGNGYLEYDGPDNLNYSFEKKFKLERDKVTSDLVSDSMQISSKDIGDYVFNKEYEAEGVYLEYDLKTQTMTFYGMKWNDIQKVKHLYMAKFEDITRKRGDRHLVSPNSNASSGTQPTHTGSSGGARQKTSGATKHSASKATAFSWSEKTSDLVVYDINKVTVKVYCADILDVPVDCIVNAANTNLNHVGGVAKFIARAAGQKFVKECDDYIARRGPLKVGEACSTSSGNLRYAYVIHTVGPSWSYYKAYDLVSVQKCETDLDMAIRNSLVCAEQLGVTSVAISAVSAGKFGCPEELCAVQYARAVLTYVGISRNPVQEIHFVDKNSTMVKEIQKVFKVAAKRGRIPKSYDPQNFVIPQASSLQAGHKAGSKSGGKTQPQYGSAADDSRWNTTYGE